MNACCALALFQEVLGIRTERDKVSGFKEFKKAVIFIFSEVKPNRDRGFPFMLLICTIESSATFLTVVQFFFPSRLLWPGGIIDTFIVWLGKGLTDICLCKALSEIHPFARKPLHLNLDNPKLLLNTSLSF